MSEDLSFTPTEQEVMVASHIPFLVGMFEGAGSMGISKVPARRGGWEYQPYITYGSNDPALAEFLAETFGGSVLAGQHPRWQIAGDYALTFARIIAPQTVHRREYTAAFDLLRSARTDEEAEHAYQTMGALNQGREYPNPRV